MNLQAVAIACTALGAVACGHDATPVAARPVAHATAPNAAPDAATARDASVASSPRAVYAGHADGRGAEPPIHEFAPHVIADAWTAQGSARLELPAGDGPVDGELRLGTLVFRARGYRVGAHVRATLEPRADGDAGADEAAFRGTLDADLTGDGASLHGTWQASSEAGVHRRQGSVEAARQ